MSKELNLEQVTPQEYRQWLKAEVKAGRLPKSELDLYHVRQEDRQFNDVGEKTSHPELQKYNIREWGVDPTEKQWDFYERMRTSTNDRYQYTILYNPREKDVEKVEAVEEPEAEAENAEVEQPVVEKKTNARKAKRETVTLD